MLCEVLCAAVHLAASVCCCAGCLWDLFMLCFIAYCWDLFVGFVYAVLVVCDAVLMLLASLPITCDNMWCCFFNVYEDMFCSSADFFKLLLAGSSAADLLCLSEYAATSLLMSRSCCFAGFSLMFGPGLAGVADAFLFICYCSKLKHLMENLVLFCTIPYYVLLWDFF
ncbi:unnamed protein product [Amaranthus hypochondriacus]